MYKTNDNEKDALRIYQYFIQNSATDSVDVTLADAFCKNELYVRASWMALAVIVFSELTGF